MVQAKDLIKTNFIKVDLNDTVSQLLGKMRLKKQTYGLVYDGKKYKGLIDRRWLLHSRVDPCHMRIKNVTKHISKRKTPFYVPKLKPTTEIEEICRLFASAAVRALPVFEKDKLLGIVTARTVMRKIKPYYRGLPVTELAKTKNLVIAQQKDETGKVLKMMNRKHVDRVPVVTVAGKIMGIVTSYDIMKRHHRWPKLGQRVPSSADHDDWGDPSWDSGEKQDILKQPIRNIMTPYPMVHCANIKSTVNQVLDIMIDEDVNSIVITDDDKPVGIITLQDIMIDYAKE